VTEEKEMKLTKFLQGIDANTCSRPGLFILAGKNKWLPLSPIAKAAVINGYKFKVGHNLNTIARKLGLNPIALREFSDVWESLRFVGWSPAKAFKQALVEAKKVDVNIIDKTPAKVNAKNKVKSKNG
jgi:hypothetical protein